MSGRCRARRASIGRAASTQRAKARIRRRRNPRASRWLPSRARRRCSTTPRAATARAASTMRDVIPLLCGGVKRLFADLQKAAPVAEETRLLHRDLRALVSKRRCARLAPHRSRSANASASVNFPACGDHAAVISASRRSAGDSSSTPLARLRSARASASCSNSCARIASRTQSGAQQRNRRPESIAAGASLRRKAGGSTVARRCGKSAIHTLGYAHRGSAIRSSRGRRSGVARACIRSRPASRSSAAAALAASRRCP